MRTPQTWAAVVVDTNVPATANKRDTHASPSCVEQCVRALEQVREQSIILLDDGWRILSEYQRQLPRSGQPEAGDLFILWLLDNKEQLRHCLQVRITPRAGDGEDYAEFPEDPALAEFDPSDRKFVAVALRSGRLPFLLNATDTDWWHHRSALAKHGVQIEFLCPELMEP